MVDHEVLFTFLEHLPGKITELGAVLEAALSADAEPDNSALFPATGKYEGFMVHGRLGPVCQFMAIPSAIATRYYQ